MPQKSPEEYSTNPNTIKARRRKMNLTGAKKVEDAARTADYKAMIHARKVVVAKDEYQNGTDAQKAAMLERAMADTMEKRRRRGQDSISKMAAYNAGLYNYRAQTTGPATRVPISAFLEKWATPTKGVPRTPAVSHTAPNTPCSSGGPSNRAQASAMTPGHLHISIEHSPASYGSQTGNNGGHKYSPNNRGIANGMVIDDDVVKFDPVGTSRIANQNGHGSVNGSTNSRHSSALFLSSPSESRRANNQSNGDVKLPAIPSMHTIAPFADMLARSGTPQHDKVNGGSSSGDMAGLRAEVHALRTVCDNMVASSSTMHAEQAVDKARISELECRTAQLEGELREFQKMRGIWSSVYRALQEQNGFV